MSIDRRDITMRSAGASRRLQYDAPGRLCASLVHFSDDVTLTSVFLFPGFHLVLLEDIRVGFL